jgi:hypothetical protein
MSLDVPSQVLTARGDFLSTDGPPMETAYSLDRDITRLIHKSIMLEQFCEPGEDMRSGLAHPSR